MWSDTVFILAAYLLGSVPHLAYLARLRRVRLVGDFHENLWTRAGKALAVLGVAGELVKGAVPVLAGRWLGFTPVTVAAGGLAAVGGQMWPVFARFDGEKGNSISIAMVIALAPRTAAVALILIIIALIIRMAPRFTARSRAEGKAIIGGPYSRSLPVGMVLFFLALPWLGWAFGEPPEIIWATALLLLLIIIRRLTAGLLDDLKTGTDIKTILWNRLLYDRAAVAWRR
jgi:glycerol-3-phosphate acyltransferase PlsY